MALQNIGAANSEDAFYRYKMPRMITKIEGRGNGIKTNIVNMVDIAKALARPASYTTKYFGCELGAQSKFDEKNGVSLVNGAHDTSKLAGLLENFIKKFVQCYGCGNPETEVLISKTQMINLKCAACGFLSDVDMRDKLTTFILKNPPEQKKGSKDKKAMRRAEKERMKEGEAADEEQKKLKKEGKKKTAAVPPKESKFTAAAKKKPASGSDEDPPSPTGSQADDNGDVEDEDDDVQWQTDTSLDAARQRIQEQLSAATAEMVMLSTVEPKQANGSSAKAPENKSVGTPHEALVKEMKEHVSKKGLKPSELSSYMETLTAPPQEAMNALIEAMFEGVGKGFAKEVGKKKNYIASVVKEETSQILLLRAIESLCGKSDGETVKEVGLVAKSLYDADVLEEEFIVKWYEEGIAGSNKSSLIWKNMKPLIEWLQSAESEEE